MPAPVQEFTPRPYQPGIDDIGDAPIGAENALDPSPDAVDPSAGEPAFRKAVLALLTEIRDLLASEPDGESM